MRRECEELKHQLLVAKLALGMRCGCSAAGKQWTLYCRARERGPFLRGGDTRQRYLGEELLLDFAVHLAGTIRGQLFGVRFYHLLEGAADPLQHKTRVWLALGGLKRLQGPGRRKHPVT